MINKFFVLINVLILSLIFTAKSHAYLTNHVEIYVLDKLTTIKSIHKVKVGDTFDMGELSIYVRRCIKNNKDESSYNSAYLTISDNNKNGKVVYEGWMFGTSKSLNPFGHSVYDIWVSKCFTK